MTGPRLLCFGCQQETTMYKPICDDCLRASGVEPKPFCRLCFAGLRVEYGLHYTADGGYAGRCAAELVS